MGTRTPSEKGTANPDLRHHGDAEMAEGLVDLAVNVREGGPPPWLAQVLAQEVAGLSSYPDATAATAAVAGLHRRPVEEVLITNGAAEAFTLLAQRAGIRRAAVVHPQFTEPEAALHDAGVAVRRVLCPEPFDLDPATVPQDADAVFVGNPTNPSGRLHGIDVLRALARPGRLVVVDEAFLDAVPGEPGSLAAERLPGAVVVRSLTKSWGLAGLRVGYVLAEASLLRRLERGRPLWPVNSLALAAARAVTTPAAQRDLRAWREQLSEDRRRMEALLRTVLGVDVVPGSVAPFLLLRVPGGQEVRERLRGLGFAVRRGDTFPGLGPDHLRVAVRAEPVASRFAAALTTCLAEAAGEAPQC